MPMNPRLLRPTTSVHPEAANWATRVRGNGGTVSGSTLNAVSRFCRRIDAEPGLRAAILRLNLFCGNSDGSLNAVRTPLYRGASLTGTQLGSAMDANVSFVAENYQETGSGGGLEGDGSSKYFNTGFNASTGISSTTSCHLSYSGTSLETSGDRAALGSYSGVLSTGGFIADVFAGYVSGRPARIGSVQPGNFPVVTSPPTAESHFVGTRTSSTALSIYRGGSLSGTPNTISQAPVFLNGNVFVFALNNSGSPGAHTAARLRMYSIGNGLTAAQALAFSNAVIAFNTALGRA
jgi:hypothetical protein